MLLGMPHPPCPPPLRSGQLPQCAFGRRSWLRPKGNEHMTTALERHVMEMQRQRPDLWMHHFLFPAVVVRNVVTGPQQPKPLALPEELLDHRGQTRIRIAHRV